MEKVGEIEIKFHIEGDSPDNHPLYPGFNPGSTVLKKDTVILPGALALPCDILKEQDISVKLRDGTTIYVDILRPNDCEYKIPTIICWGPFGKNGGVNRMGFGKRPWRCGVPQRTVSGLENFEAPDPAYWCNHGYAVVHPDIRGAWTSDGESYIDSELEGQDGYDVIEWIAEQPWSNGRVTLAGNSWLTQCQWFIGAQQPPHLTCLCPWEGWNDLYNDNVNRGGIPDPWFQDSLLRKSYAGRGKTENIAAMSLEHNNWNEYWESRKAKLDKINVPMYIVSSWTNFLHTRGTFRGYMESSGCKDKWLRVHNSHEWPDLYYSQNTEDLRKFLDHYMKDISNDWQFTPKVRLSILNPGHNDVINRPETDFPLPQQKSARFYLSAANESLILEHNPSSTHTISFSAKEGIVKFTHSFKTRTELTGFWALKLVVSSPTNAEDIDLFVQVSKLSKSGEKLETNTVDTGYMSWNPEKDRKDALERHQQNDASVDVYYADGPHGRLRVSHRELDPATSTPHWPRYTHKNPQTLKEGEVVGVDIELWPCGMIWEAGEQLQVQIGGHNLASEGLPWLEPCKTINKEGGEIAIHTGGKYESYLLAPLIPQA